MAVSTSASAASRRRCCGTCGPARRRSASSALPEAEIADLCASFQRTVVADAARRAPFEAAPPHGARAVGVAGGVSANSRLRAELRGAAAARGGLPVFVPPLALATDNAAMIAAAGLRLARGAASFASDRLNAVPSLVARAERADGARVPGRRRWSASAAS